MHCEEPFKVIDIGGSHMRAPNVAFLYLWWFSISPDGWWIVISEYIRLVLETLLIVWNVFTN